MKSIGKNSIFNMFYKLSDMIIPLIMSAYIARVLLAEGVGLAAYAQNLVSYFCAFAKLGLSVYGTRETARMREEHLDSSRVFSELFLVNAALTTCALAAYYSFLLFSGNIKSHSSLFLVCGISLFFNYMNIDWLFQGEEEYGFIAVKNLVVKLFLLVLVFGAVRTAGDYVRYVLIVSLAEGGNHFINVVRAHKYVKLKFRAITPLIHLKPIVVLSLGMFAASVYCEISVTMLGLLSAKSETGYYSYAFTAVKMVTNLCASAAGVFFPRLSYYYKTDQGKFYRLLNLGMRVSVFLAVPACACVFILAPQMVHILFGSAYSPVAALMRILCFLILIWGALDVPGTQLLLVTGNEKMRIWAYFIALPGTAALDCIAIRVYGSGGAAFVYVAGELVVNVYLACRLHRQFPFAIPYKALLQALASTAVMGIAVHCLIRGMSSLLLQCIAGAAGCVFVYGAVNLLLGNELVLAGIHRIKERTGI